MDSAEQPRGGRRAPSGGRCKAQEIPCTFARATVQGSGSCRSGWWKATVEAGLTVDRQELEGLLGYMDRIPVSLRRLTHRAEEG